MKRRMKAAKKSKSVNMMGKSREPFAKKAKKPEADEKPFLRRGTSSTNKNMRQSKSARVRRLAGTLI